jgi:hypothetical protein
VCVAVGHTPLNAVEGLVAVFCNNPKPSPCACSPPVSLPPGPPASIPSIHFPPSARDRIRAVGAARAIQKRMCERRRAVMHTESRLVANQSVDATLKMSAVVASPLPNVHGLPPSMDQELSDRDAKIRRFKNVLRDTMIRGIIDEKQVCHPSHPAPPPPPPPPPCHRRCRF